MPSLQPFAGVRYDRALAPLDRVVAPPYDVVGSQERDLLGHRSPFNAIHLELPKPDLESGRDPYLNAADLLDSWLERGVLVADARPALYPYRMTQADGWTTTGIIGALGISDDVLPHEETMPKPRSDRLDLLRATGANLSPIWGLSLTPGLTATFDPKGAPAADTYDDEGVRHQLWVLDDPGALAAVAAAIAASPVVLADGHHRYETARTYRAEARAANGDRAGDYDAVMALVVELSERELQVHAIHRVLDFSGSRADASSLLVALGRHFDLVHAGPATSQVVGALTGAGSVAAVAGGDAWLLTVRAGAFEAASTDLEAGLVDLALRELPDVAVSYTAHWQEALAGARAEDHSARTKRAAILLRPVQVAQISQWARARRRMPPKTTFFTPKPRTGMVFRLLSGRTDF